MSEIVIRIWDGPQVVQVINVDQRGGSSTVGAVGGASNGANPQIEIDPWKGHIVDHRASSPTPVEFRTAGIQTYINEEEDDED